MGRLAKVLLVGALVLALTAGIAVAQSPPGEIDCTEAGRQVQNCNGKAGGDEIYGSIYKDFIRAYGGNDSVYGASGADTILGGAGSDVIHGHFGADYLADDGGRGDTDILFGGKGDDLLSASDGDSKDSLDCGSGYDYYTNFDGDKVSRNCEQEAIFD